MDIVRGNLDHKCIPPAEDILICGFLAGKIYMLGTVGKFVLHGSQVFHHFQVLAKRGHGKILRNAVVDQSAIGKMILPAEADQICSFFFQGFHADRPGMRLQIVIRVDKGQKIPAYFCHAVISGGGDTAVGFVKEADAVIAGSQRV